MTKNNSIYPNALVVNSPYNQMGTFGINGSSAARHDEPLSNIGGFLSFWNKEKKLFMTEAYKKAVPDQNTMTYKEWLKTPMAQTVADKYDADLVLREDMQQQGGGGTVTTAPITTPTYSTGGLTGMLNSVAGNSIVKGLTNGVAIGAPKPLTAGGVASGAGTNGFGTKGNLPPENGSNTTTWLIVGGGVVLVVGILAIVLLSRGKKPATVVA